MPDVIIIGDGPGGLSAALFLAKNKLDVVVFGEDKTAMNYAFLENYLGVPATSGSDFQKTAREQVTRFGARLVAERVTKLEQDGDRFTVELESGARHSARYLVLSEGKAPRLAKQLGLAFESPGSAGARSAAEQRGESKDDGKGIATDRNAKASVDRVYVVGRSARPGRSQAIISAGDGAAAAIDILSREKGEDFLDWDEPPKG